MRGSDLWGVVVQDLIDLATSPNDFLIFILWHSNIMRHFLRWQQVSLQADPSLNHSYWGFPVSNVDYPEGNPGCNLDDVINSNFAFTDPFLFPHPPKTGSAYTHREVMELFSPGADQLCDYEETERAEVWERASASVDQRFFG